MKLIVGLGNPGKEYERTRHNVGAIFVDYLKKKEIPQGIIAAKTDTFMNDSGLSVRKMVDYYKLELDKLCVVHDDLDIPLGSYKIQKGKGPKLHNGILSIENELSSTDFWRIRVGVDARDNDNRIPGEKYVLEKFSEEELKILQGLFPQIEGEIINNLND